jgi:hypothetical protein
MGDPKSISKILVILQWKPMVKFRFFSILRNTQGQHLTLEPWLGIHSEYSCPVIGCWLLHWDSRRSEDTRNGHHDPFHPHLCLNSPSKLVGPPWFVGIVGEVHMFLLGLNPPFASRLGRPIGERHRHLSKHFGGCAPAETAQGAYRSFKRGRPMETKTYKGGVNCLESDVFCHGSKTLRFRMNIQFNYQLMSKPGTKLTDPLPYQVPSPTDCLTTLVLNNPQF